MSSTKYLLIGGGLASMEAIKAIRKADPTGPVTLVSAEPHLPYDRPPLSKEFLRGEKPRERLYFQPETFFRNGKIETLLGVHAESLDLASKTVVLSDGRPVTFEKALIATGGSPIRLSMPGVEREGVYYFRNMEDAQALAREAAPGKRGVVIGAGFIGLEVAASLARRGAYVTVVEVASHIWPRFANETIASYFQRYCEGMGVRFLTSDTVTEIRGGKRPTSVATKSGKDLPCDFAVIGVGIRPNVELAQAAGLKVDNGIVVDEKMRASHPDVFAAGDVCNYPDPVFGKRRRVEHWGHTEYTGQVAGQNMAGGDAAYGLLTYVWSDIFDLHLEFAGDESEHDRTVVRGKFEDNKFTVLYLKGGMLRAYFAVNTDAKDFPVYQRFIKRKKDLSGLLDKLEDTSMNPRTLL